MKNNVENYILCIAVAVFITITTMLFVQNWEWLGYINFEIASKYGSLIGGLLSFISVLLIYYSLKQQKDAFEISSFENRFFQMMDQHRKNVEVWVYRNPSSANGEEIRGAKIFVKIKKEIEEAIQIVEREFEFKKDDQGKINYASIELSDMLNENARDGSRNNSRLESFNKVAKIQLEIINIAYLIVFNGLGKYDCDVLEEKLKKRYNKDKVEAIIKKALSRIAKWDKIVWLKEQDGDINEEISYNQRIKDNKYFKYFGGHQHRLGHYYRHLFQTVKYVDNYKPFKGKYNKKYSYVKTLRAQLSNDEQAVFLYNSLSDLGKEWEIEPKEIKKRSSRCNDELVTKYNLVKNIHNSFYNNFSQQSFYPYVEFEGINMNEEKKQTRKKYKYN